MAWGVLLVNAFSGSILLKLFGMASTGSLCIGCLGFFLFVLVDWSAAKNGSFTVFGDVRFMEGGAGLTVEFSLLTGLGSPSDIATPSTIIGVLSRGEEPLDLTSPSILKTAPTF